jgi:hypothetical protein
MALKLQRQNRYVPSFDGNRESPEGEQISVAYRSMSVQDVMTVQEATGVNILMGSQKDGEDSFTTNWSVIRAVLESYCSDWKNISIDDQPLTDSKAVLDALSMRYLGLFAEIFQFILVASVGTEDDAKNFTPGSAQTKAEPGIIAPPVAMTTSESETVVVDT